GQPEAILLSGLVGVNVTDTADRANPMGSPGLALAGRQTHPVERGGDILVRPLARHLAHDRQGIVGGAAAVFSRARLTQAQFGVPSALPVDDQNDLLCRLSMSTMISLTRARTSCWRQRMVTRVFFHAASRSSAMAFRSGIAG